MAVKREFGRGGSVNFGGPKLYNTQPPTGTNSFACIRFLEKCVNRRTSSSVADKRDENFSRSVVWMYVHDDSDLVSKFSWASHLQ